MDLVNPHAKKKQDKNKQKIQVYSALVYSKSDFDNPIFVTELQILEINWPRSSECKALLATIKFGL